MFGFQALAVGRLEGLRANAWPTAVGGAGGTFPTISGGWASTFSNPNATSERTARSERQYLPNRR